MKILRTHGGVATIHAGVSIERCQGGYMRNFGEANDAVAITIHKEDKE